jgi:hypothetical protein
MTKDIAQIIEQSFCEPINKGKLPLQVSLRRNQRFNNAPSLNLHEDYRTNINNHKLEHISLLVVEKPTHQTAFSTSFIFYNKTQLELIKFWKRINDRLYKISGEAILKKYEPMIMTIGYTYVYKKSFMEKYQFTQEFINLCSSLIKMGLFIFVETTGTIKPDKSMYERNELDLSEFQNYSKQIGITNNDSKAVEKFSLLIGLTEAIGIYNLKTLGKVYFSDQII